MDRLNKKIKKGTKEKCCNLCVYSGFELKFIEKDHIKEFFKCSLDNKKRNTSPYNVCDLYKKE